jgi:hypothetical protein
MATARKNLKMLSVEESNASPEHLELTERFQATQFNFLVIALRLCHTFLDLAKMLSEVGNGHDAKRSFEKAGAGYATAIHFSASLTIARDRNQIKRDLKILRVRLDEISAIIRHRPLMPNTPL